MDRINVLLVEDNPADADYVVERLGECRDVTVNVTVASCLADAVQKAVSDPSVRAVLLDLSLPDAHGVDTVIRLRAAAPRPGVVILTGAADNTLWQKCFDAGAQDYLPKGNLTADSLIRSIRYAIVRKQLSDELDARERRQREIDEMKTEFFHRVNHELVTPIVCVAESLNSIHSLNPPPETAAHVDVARRNADHLLRLTADLVDLARMESTQFAVEKAPVDIRVPVQSAGRTLAALAAERGIRLTTAADSAVVLPVDSQRIEQAVVNLARNAIQYARSEVRISVIRDGGVCRITVDDDGNGIDPVDLPRIFDKFYRGRTRKKQSGSGLGLAIVKTIVESHGGSVQTGPRPDAEGARFTISLPCPT